MSRFEKVLAIDTAMNACCAGVYNAAREKRVARAEIMPAGHGERLLPLVNEVMAEAGLGFSELDAVLVTVGPGAFTGLRIGLSAAKSLGTALGIPVFGITTLQALALQYAAAHKGGGGIAVIIETKREDFYFQVFSGTGAPEGEEKAVAGTAGADILRLGRYTVIGDGLPRFRQVTENQGLDSVVWDESCMLVDAGFVALNFYENKERGNAYTASAVPVYLRGADVTTPKTPQRVLHSSH